MPEKTCNRCGETKSLDEFYRSPGMRDGHRNDCKACNLAEKKRRYEADPQLAIQRVREWQLRNPERVSEYLRKRRAQPEIKRRDRAGHLRRKYGITLDQYDALLASQGGVCAICKAPPNDVISLHVDHEHGSGRVRGLLCIKCNNAIGLLNEDPELFAAAVRYLTARVASPDL